MRRTALIVVAAIGLAACSSNESTSPADISQITDFVIGANGTALTSAGGYDADLFQLRLLNGLPDDLKLTPEQQAKIKALVDAFQAATKADHDALAGILRDAMAAIAAHKSRDEVKAILDKGLAIRQRLSLAEAKLRSDIEAVLTPEQKAWLASHEPQRCDPSKFPPLTDAQKAQMRALETAFQTANKTDIDAVQAAMQQVRAAVAAGKSRDQIQAILDGVKPAIDRLEAARRALRAQLESVLTPEQKASGCIPLG
jgi:Spy/CpxP family protein refolding chaperone